MDPHVLKGAPGIDPDIRFDDDGRIWYAGALLGLYASGNGSTTDSFADFDWVHYEAVRD